MKQEVLRLLRVLACAGPLLAGTVAVLAAQEPEPYEVKSPRLRHRVTFAAFRVVATELVAVRNNPPGPRHHSPGRRGPRNAGPGRL